MHLKINIILSFLWCQDVIFIIIKKMSKYEDILEKINPADFKIPINQMDKDYFPDFLEKKLVQYVTLYEEKFVPVIDRGIPFSPGSKDPVFSKIKLLTESLNKTVEYFYNGEILKATETFNQGMDKVFFKDLSILNFSTKVAVDQTFYRARISEQRLLKRADLFHINFNLRHLVSTNRYSIPGFPALYLGDTSYICWEEFDQPELKNLNFSLFKNTRELNIIQLLRIEDLLAQLQGNKSEEIPFLLTYFVFFPLTLACSIKVRQAKGNFKPEYIIPQLLLQYINENPDYDGLKYSSSKVDYSKLHNMTSYNYVFPVKKIKAQGYCDNLENLFHCTQPTSLNLEEIVHNPVGTSHSMPPSTDDRQIELIEDLRSPYTRTSFGKLEHNLKNRGIGKI